MHDAACPFGPRPQPTKQECIRGCIHLFTKFEKESYNAEAWRPVLYARRQLK